VSVSLPQYPSVTCVNCVGTFAPELYVIVDVTERPDLLKAIRDDILHCVLCPHCSTVIAVGLPLMVYRPQESVRILYSPWPDATPAQQHEHLDALFAHLRRRLGRRWNDGLTRRIFLAERSELPVVGACDLDLLPGGGDQTLRDAMLKFFGCRTWEQARALVQAQPVLLRPEAAVFLRRKGVTARNRRDLRTSQVMDDYLAVLEDCVSQGVDAAFAARLDGSGQTRMPDVLE